MREDPEETYLSRRDHPVEQHGAQAFENRGRQLLGRDDEVEQLGAFVRLRRLTEVSEPFEQGDVAQAEGNDGVWLEIADLVSALEKEESEVGKVAVRWPSASTHETKMHKSPLDANSEHLTILVSRQLEKVMMSDLKDVGVCCPIEGREVRSKPVQGGV